MQSFSPRPLTSSENFTLLKLRSRNPSMPYDVLIMLTRPSILLRIEEAALLLFAICLYQHLHYSWLLFAILFLAPDLSMAGFLINPGAGAATYNLVHTLWLPIALLFAGYLLHWPSAPAITLIWIAHIAMDRLLGFGLKYPTFFKDTHLQHIP